MKAKLLILTCFFLSGSLLAQKNWDHVDFEKEYKRKVKINGASAKALKNNKTFVNGYTVSQAVTMKGSESTATKAVYSEVSLGGLDNENYQQMVDELYRDFVAELEAAGLQVTNGNDVLASNYALERKAKDKNDEYIGSTGDNPAYEGKRKITEGSMPGYGAWAVTQDITFPPRNKNIYLTSDIIKSGNFYARLANKENFNLISVSFYVSFAKFDGGRGYKDIKLSTEPALAVSAAVNIVTSNGAFNQLYYKDLPVWGSAEWSEGISTKKDNKHTAEAFGLARSADYEITANADRYLEEVRQIISNLQKNIAKGIKDNL